MPQKPMGTLAGVVLGLVAAEEAAAGAFCRRGAGLRQQIANPQRRHSCNTTPAMNNVFVTHGAGPGFFIDGPRFEAMGVGPKSDYTQKLGALGQQLQEQKPNLIMVVSAHWVCEEQDSVYIDVDKKPGMLFDYGGFPKEAYEYKYNAPGSPEAAAKLVELLKGQGITGIPKAGRGWDHGVFIPLMKMFPKADVPVLAVSVNGAFDGDFHLRLGAALKHFLDDGAVLITSGSSEHGTTTPEQHDKFDAWLQDTVTSPTTSAEDRFAKLRSYRDAPYYKNAHPSDEHFIPLHASVGAAQGAAGVTLASAKANIFSKGGTICCFGFE